MSKKLSDIFDIMYGNSLELYQLQETDVEDIEGVNFISRTRENNGVSAIVKPIPDIQPFEKGLITVAGSGNSILESFIQPKPFYTGYHVFILKPKVDLTEIEQLFYCHCIRKNRYRYSFGRQANKTLKDLIVPDKMPKELSSISIKSLDTVTSKSASKKSISLDIKDWKWFEVAPTLFEVSASKDKLIDNLTLGGTTPYITSTEYNNGVLNFIKEEATNKAGTITANRGGSVGHFFYQPVDYQATPVDVRILTPNFPINKYVGLFVNVILRLEKFRFNYSRKMGTDRIKKLRIKLPSKNGEPDVEFMEQYIKSLPFSSSL